MLRETTLKNALQVYLSGGDVRVILPAEDDEERLVPVERLFHSCRFLIDKKPAVDNPEFETAIADMVSQAPPSRQTLVTPPAMWVPVPAVRD